MPLKLSAEQKSVLDIFTNIKYLVPVYQRPYSWDIQNCSELWDDLYDFFNGDNRNDGYFLGNIVLANSQESDQCEIIDGQQRLITLSLLVKALYLKDKNNSALDGILWIHDRRNPKDRKQRLESAVLELNQYDSTSNNFTSDNSNLYSCLNTDSLEGIQKNQSIFHRNLDFFYSRIEENEKNNNLDINKFSDFILDNVFLLPISTDDYSKDVARDKALTIFETINNRGLDLSDADIFKAQLYISAANISKQNDFVSRWNSMSQRVQDINYKIDDIFRVYMHALRGKNKDISVETRLRYFFNTDTIPYIKPLKKQNYDDVLKDLEKIIFCVEYYYSLLHGNFSDSFEEEITKWFQIIDVYSNNFPKVATFVYLFNNAVKEKDVFKLPESKFENFIKQTKNIIKYVYAAGATSTVKFKIFEIIKDVMHDKLFEYNINTHKNNELELEYFGKIKKGFMLIYIYQNMAQDIIIDYRLDTIQRNSNERLGNFLIVDKTTYKVKNLEDRIKRFKESNIVDLKNISPLLANWDEQKAKDRETNIIKDIKTFFERAE